MSRRLAIALSALAIGLTPAVAQDFTLDPTFGETDLLTGFGTYSVDLVAGGDIDAFAALGGECAGFIADAPDYRIQFEGEVEALEFSVVSGADTTIVVNDPEGAWYCNDDFYELDPSVYIEFPYEGQYDVWVGTFDATTADATLYIDEYTAAEPDSSDDMMGDDDMMGAMMPDFGLDPSFGEVDLSAGFGSYSIDIVAGGLVDAFDALGDQGDHSCFGYIAEAPDFRVHYDGAGASLTISNMSEADTTLVVNDPNGTWHCDDDSAGYPNPAVTLSNPPSGQYDIWVGTFSEEEFPDATLTVSEDGTPASDGGGAMPDFALDPTFGETTLAPGFDPVSIDLVAGGDIDAQAVGDDCWGFVAAAPDYRVFLDAAGGSLVISAESADDTTLVVNAPDAGWYCNDDGGENTFDPELVFDDADPGQYDVWVGTFFGGTAEATLRFSRQQQKGGGQK